MEEKSLFRKRKRNWLNPASHENTGSAQTVASITQYFFKDGKVDIDLDVCITLRDCSRQIALDFNISLDPACTKSELRKELELRRKKLSILRDHLDLVEESLIRFDEIIETKKP